MSSLPQPGHGQAKRPCTKVQHPTWGDAARERDRLEAQFRARGESRQFDAYHCACCGNFHVGTKRERDTGPGPEATRLRELLQLLPRPIAWAEFKAQILPGFEPPLVSRQHGLKVKRCLGELEALDLADDGEPTRHIETTADLSPKLVSRLVASRPPCESPYTLRDRLSFLQSLCRLAVEYRCLAVSPFAIRPIRRIVRVGKPRDKRALSREEIRRLFDVLRGDVASKKGWALWRARRLLVAVSIAIYTGLRRNELLTLNTADLDLDARVIRLKARGDRGMGLKTEGSAQPVGMPIALIPIVRDWLAHRLDGPAGFPVPDDCPWLIPNCRRTGPWLNGHASICPLGRLKAVALRAGIQDVNWQMLRRTLATQLESFGAGEAGIQRQLRHSDPKVSQEHYRKADERNIADLMRDVVF